MITEPRQVRSILTMKVNAGYQPSWTYESCVDHDVLWTAISRAEFERILARGKSARGRGERHAAR